MDDLAGELLFLLHDVARLMRVNGDKRARTQGMTRAQWVMLIRLARQPGLSQKELAELLEVEPITVARLIDRLAQRGLLERRPDPNDRRIWRLHLLPPGHQLLADMAPHKEDMLREVTEGIPASALRTMTEALRTMKANLCEERDAARRTETARTDTRRVA